MTVHRTAYDTTACRDFAMKKTLDALAAAHIDGWLIPANTRSAGDPRDTSPAKVNPRVLLLEGGSSQADAVPPFAHPVLFVRNNEQYIVIDVRAFGRFDPHQQQFKVRNAVDYHFALMRAALDEIWNSEDRSILQNINQQPMAIFASWISESVGRRFSLDPGEQYKLSILAAIFYASQFFWSEDAEHNQLTDTDKNRIAAAITRALKVAADDVFDVLDQVSHVSNAMEFCLRSREVLQSVRLNDFNVGVLFSIVGGTWYGANARELTAVALEHPPTWLAILLAAINERTYKNSGIARLAERFTRRGGDQLVPALFNVIRLHA